VPDGRTVAALARTYTHEAIQTLAEAMRDGKASWNCRIDAASRLLDRGHGRAAQNVNLEVHDGADPALLSRQALMAILSESAEDADYEELPEGAGNLARLADARAK
jgi:hypothetical protein